MKVGDYVILKGQRKGRYHLEGGVLTQIDDRAAVVVNDDENLIVILLDQLEPFTEEYKTPRGNKLVKIELKDGSINTL